MSDDLQLLEEAERSLLRETKRLKAQRDLVAFTEWTFPKYRTAPVHRTIAEQLERVERGEIDQLMLLCPPRHGKSTLASRHFPAYYLGRHPDRQFISASASASLAADFGRDVRNIVASQEYADIFETRLAEDSQAKDLWRTNEGGIFYAVGVGSQVMGRGANVLLIDDAFGSMEDAQSETERNRVWAWYSGSCYNRLEDNGAIVVIGHRMSEDDLQGRLLAQQAAGGDRWEVVELKASPEEPLWPEKYDSRALARIKANTQPRFFAALYLQNPIPDEGTYFLSSYFKTYTEEPDPRTLRVYMSLDAAVSEGRGDYTAIVVAAQDPEGRLLILDLYRAQASTDVWLDALSRPRPQVQAAGGGNRIREPSSRQWGPSSSRCAPARLTWQSKRSQLDMTKVCARNRSAASPRCKVSGCRRAHRGVEIYCPRWSASRILETMMSSTA